MIIISLFNSNNHYHHWWVNFCMYHFNRMPCDDVDYVSVRKILLFKGIGYRPHNSKLTFSTRKDVEEFKSHWDKSYSLDKIKYDETGHRVNMNYWVNFLNENPVFVRYNYRSLYEYEQDISRLNFIHSQSIYFETEEDMTAFLLRWS